MRFTKLILTILLILLILTGCSKIATTVPAGQYDIIVYGGTSGGVIAAIQADKMQKSVLLIEPTEHLGGLTISGLGATDIGNKNAIGGLSRQFYKNIYKHYHGTETEGTQWTFEPHVAEKTYKDMLSRTQVTVLLNERLDLKDGVLKNGNRIVAVKMESNRLYKAKMFIDATYEGDLMAKAGISYTTGRESNQTYSETLNGVQTKNAIHHQFIKPVDPFTVPGDPKSGTLPGIDPAGPGNEGSADKRIQAYCFRICATNVPENSCYYDEDRNEIYILKNSKWRKATFDDVKDLIGKSIPKISFDPNADDIRGKEKLKWQNDNTSESAEIISFELKDSLDLDASMFVATVLTCGEIEIDLETGNVTMPDDMAVDDASKEFWKWVEEHFREDAKMALRLRMYQEIAGEARYGTR